MGKHGETFGQKYHKNHHLPLFNSLSLFFRIALFIGFSHYSSAVRVHPGCDSVGFWRILWFVCHYSSAFPLDLILSMGKLTFHRRRCRGWELGLSVRSAWVSGRWYVLGLSSSADGSASSLPSGLSRSSTRRSAGLDSRMSVSMRLRIREPS